MTKEKFDAYIKVQESGITNMFDVIKVAEYSGLDKDTIMFIMKNYDFLKNLYK